MTNKHDQLQILLQNSETQLLKKDHQIQELSFKNKQFEQQKQNMTQTQVVLSETHELSGDLFQQCKILSEQINDAHKLLK